MKTPIAIAVLTIFTFLLIGSPGEGQAPARSVVVSGQPAATAVRSNLAVEEHRMFDLVPDVKLNASEAIIASNWRTEEAVDLRLFESPPRAIGVAPPGPYQIEFTATVAEVATMKVTLADGREVERRVAILPEGQDQFATFSQVFTIEVKGSRPPPDDEDEDEDEDEGEDSAPFANAGFSILIVRETGDLLPKEQSSIFTNAKVLKFGSQAVADGGFFRIWDGDHADQLGGVEDDLLKAAYLKTLEAKKSLPWLAVANGSKGWSGPLPGSADEVIRIFEQVKGAN